MKITEKGVWYDVKGQRYRKRITYENPMTGVKQQKIISATDYIELIKKIDEFRRSIDIDGGDYSRLTVGEYLDSWLEKKKLTKKPKTIQSYANACNNHIKPALGDCLIQRLKKKHVQKFLDGLVTQKLSPSSVASVRRIFRVALNDAYDDEIIDRNPIVRTVVPTVHKKPPVTLEQEEMIRLFKLAYSGDFLPASNTIDSEYIRKQFFVALCVAMGTAMRKGELFGLKWTNFEKNTITIENNLVEVSGRMILGTPKTQDSTRKIVLPDALANLLRAWKQKQAEYAKVLGDVFQNKNNMIFTNSVGNFVNTNNFYKRWWNPLRIAVGLPLLKWHNIRSASCSYMASHDIDRRIVGQIAGHADTRTTEAYYIGTVQSQEQKRLDVMQDWAVHVLCDLDSGQ